MRSFARIGLLVALAWAAPAWAQNTGPPELSEADHTKEAENRRSQIAFLEDVLGPNHILEGDTPVELRLRLAKLYREEGRDLTRGGDPAQGRIYAEKAIALCGWIEEHYPQYARIDQVLLAHGGALQDAGQTTEALAQFMQIVKSHPESRFVPDAWVAMGDLYFDSSNATKALQAYTAATQYPASDTYPHALYQLAWCYYNIGEYGKAIDTMKILVALPVPVGDPAAAAWLRPIQDQALTDLMRFFADAGFDAGNTCCYCGSPNPVLYREMLRRLAPIYMEQGKFDQAIQTWHRLIAESPSSPEAPSYAYQIIVTYQQQGRWYDTLDELIRFQKTYGAASAWAKANAANPDAVLAASDRLKHTLRDLALQPGDETKSVDPEADPHSVYAFFSKVFAIYLADYPDAEDNTELRAQFAMHLFQGHQYAEAYDQGVKVLATDPNAPHSMLCAEVAMLSAAKMVQAEADASGGALAQGTAPIPLTEWDQRLVAASQQYLLRLAGGPKLPEVAFNLASLYYGKNHFMESTDIYRLIIAEVPESALAVQSARNLMETFTRVEDWAALQTIALSFYELPDLGDATFKKEAWLAYTTATQKLQEGK